MIILSTRYGCMLRCGWLPPIGNTAAGFIVVFGVLPYGLDGSAAHVLFVGRPAFDVPELPDGKWVCAAISLIISVWLSWPLLSPSVVCAPMCTGARLRKSGSAKFTRPSP